MDDPLLRARVAIPEHVVRRRFAEESIALNLRTGQYHGLNATADEILDALAAGAAPEQVARAIAERTGAPPGRVSEDVLGLLRALAERELVEIHERDAG
ncbi:MAG TPA: PqqD family protein [Solirubrobacteraceae bacterium]|nr:PqqD family protein [Solirubrobacteraceae bacterium]